MLARLLTFVVWALVAASGLYWGLKLFVRAPTVPPLLTLAAAKPSAQADWGKLFGPDVLPAAAEAAPAPALDSRFQLFGVVAPRGAGQGGVALIGMDGRPAKAYRIGAAVDGALVLQAVLKREATLGPAGGPAQVRLQMTPVAAALSSAPAVPVASAFGFPPGAGRPPPPAPMGMAAVPSAMPIPLPTATTPAAPRRRASAPFGVER